MEYTVSRRHFMSLAGASVSTFLMRPNITKAQNAQARHLVLINPTGAFDGYAILQPTNLQARPAYQFNANTRFNGAFPIAESWLLNPKASALLPLWQNQELSFIPSLGIPNADTSRRARDLMEYGSDALITRAQPWSERLNKTENLNVWDIAPGHEGPFKAVFDMIPGLHEKIALVYEGFSMDQTYNLKDHMRPETATFAELGVLSTLSQRLSALQNPTLTIVSLPGFDASNQPFHREKSDQFAGLVGQMMGYFKECFADIWPQTMIALLPERGLKAKQRVGAPSEDTTGSLGLIMGGAINGGQIFFETNDGDKALIDPRDVVITALIEYLNQPARDVYNHSFQGFQSSALPFILA